MYYKDMRTKKVFIKNRLTSEDMLRLQDGEVVHITEDEYDQESGKAPIGSTLCKIFATVNRRDFENFKDRCRTEGVNMDTALSSLVSLYGAGATLHHVSHKALEGFSYIKAQASAAAPKKE